MAVPLLMLAALVGAAGAAVANGTAAADSCGLTPAPWDQGPWGALLEQWTLSAPSQPTREGRILALPPANGYYVTDRIGGAPLPPPPARAPPRPRPYDEWRPPPPPAGPGKIVNKPPHDNFRPSLPGPLPAADRVDVQQQQQQQQQPPRQVSETDLYLLGAIEKLTYRLDLMEKRLRKAEESLHYLVAGADPKPEPCAEQFSRVGGGCYHFSAAAADWKAASLACRRLRASLLELDSVDERRTLTAALQTDKRLKDTDWWTGGLNPGLLWIWSHSARPVGGNSTANGTSGGAGGGAGGAAGVSGPSIAGDGRCLALAFEPALRTHVYRGQDCALRRRYVCELEEDRLRVANEIERVARALRGPPVAARLHDVR